MGRQRDRNRMAAVMASAHQRETAARVVRTAPPNLDNQVVTVEGGDGTYMRRPCAECPWRVDQTGSFPAEAFRISANTAYDMSHHVFGCHMAGPERPATCAGFLLLGADDNLVVRLRYLRAEIDRHTVSSDVELHQCYRAMAVANGVDPDDPAIRGCRP